MASEFQKAMADAMFRQQQAFVEQFGKYQWGNQILQQQAQAAQPEYEYRLDTYANINLPPSVIRFDGEPRDTIPAPPIFGIDFGVEPSRTIETTFRKRLDGQWVIEGYTEIPAPPPTAPECRECSRPERPIAATHGELCVYCANSHGIGPGCNERPYPDRESAEVAVMAMVDGWPAEAAARARLAATDRKAQPRATAESRMLALPHPWECGGEDEP